MPIQIILGLVPSPLKPCGNEWRCVGERLVDGKVIADYCSLYAKHQTQTKLKELLMKADKNCHEKTITCSQHSGIIILLNTVKFTNVQTKNPVKQAMRVCSHETGLRQPP